MKLKVSAERMSISSRRADFRGGLFRAILREIRDRGGCYEEGECKSGSSYGGDRV